MSAREGGSTGEEPESVSVYIRIRSLFGSPVRSSADARRRARAATRNDTIPFGPGREPRSVANVLDSLTAQHGWDSPLARAELVRRWADVVGEDTAQHSTPESISDGTLVVRCSSTAWAQQLRVMKSSLLAAITQTFPHAGITQLHMVGPDAPSWKRGLRDAGGRGPRDTYG